MTSIAGLAEHICVPSLIPPLYNSRIDLKVNSTTTILRTLTAAVQQVYAVFKEYPCLGLSWVFVCLFFHGEKVIDLQEFYILVVLTKLGQDSSLPPEEVTAHELLHQISDTKPWGRSWYMKHWQRTCLQTQSFFSYFCQFYSILAAMSYILSTSFSIILVYAPISPGHSWHVWSACFSWVYDDLWILDDSLFSGQGDCEVWNSAWDFVYIFTGCFWVHAPLAESH